ncbi:MAG: hypothetical protein J4432_03865 [DPANN group archaeon]|nr:hypothetical protein [DPANN group archaeon]
MWGTLTRAEAECAARKLAVEAMIDQPGVKVDSTIAVLETEIAALEGLLRGAQQPVPRSF